LPLREVTVEPGSRDLHGFAWVHATGHGRISFTPERRGTCASYLLGGGFLHVDDNYGLDESFREAVRVVFPRPATWSSFPSLTRSTTASSSSPAGCRRLHEHHGGPPHGYGIVHEGRVVLFYSFNTDLGNGWESAEVHGNPEEIREQALRMGTNLLVYALSR
jgi:hypothetical protein